MDWCIGSPRTWSVVGVRGPGSVFSGYLFSKTIISLVLTHDVCDENKMYE